MDSCQSKKIGKSVLEAEFCTSAAKVDQLGFKTPPKLHKTYVLKCGKVMQEVPAAVLTGLVTAEIPAKLTWLAWVLSSNLYLKDLDWCLSINCPM